jgi:hypothetical protein
VISFLILTDKSGNKDSDDGERADESDEEPEHSEKLCIAAEGASVGKFIIDVGLLESPADEEDGQEASEGHQDIGREIVKEIKEIASIYLYVRERSE